MKMYTIGHIDNYLKALIESESGILIKSAGGWIFDSLESARKYIKLIGKLDEYGIWSLEDTERTEYAYDFEDNCYTLLVPKKILALVAR